MSQRLSSIRQLRIISFLKRNKATFPEIQQYLEKCSLDLGENLSLSRSTFTRDIGEIASIYGIEIVCNKKNDSAYSLNIFNAIEKYAVDFFETFSALNSGRDLVGSILFESRRPNGIENMSLLIHAIRNKFEISFSYTKFYEKESQKRIVYPLGLKENANLWYLVTFCTLRNDIRTFALDRITELEVVEKVFKYEDPMLMTNMFNDCFGVVRQENGSKVEEIILSFDSFRGNYIKNFPLHKSQTVIADNDNELRIKLNIHITRDFLSELLKYTGSLAIISPDSLRQRYLDLLKKGIEIN